MLYAYPMLKDLENAYEDHIKNKAVLSYKYVAPCEGLVEYITSEIQKKNRLAWLENLLNGVMDKLNETERALLEMRYFCKRRFGKEECARAKIESWSESTYFRMQNRLEKRLEHLLKREGLTEQVFDEWFAPMQAFRYVCGYLQKKERVMTERERQLFC